MAVTVTFTVTPTAPAHGDTVTATYVVTGNDPLGGQVVTLTGDVKIGTVDYPVSASLTLPGAPPQAESYQVPACPGLTFRTTADPRVFTALVP